MSALSRGGRLLADLARVTVRYVRSPAFRRAAMSALASPSTPLELSEATLRELAASPEAARPYAGLSGAALAMSALTCDANAEPTVRLVLAELDPGRIFAGVHTALRVADGLAARIGLPLQVVLLSEAISAGRRDRLLDTIVERLGRDRSRTTVLTRDALATASAHPGDVWVATHWTTAHPLQVAARAGVIDPARVVYLVQDHEPGFTALSTDRVTASATYRAGFRLLVNSEPVAAVLRAAEGVVVDAALVFAPDLPLDRLSTIAAQRPAVASERPVTVLFYGRPSKPRNLFPLGIAALRIAAQGLPGEHVRWISAGEPHRPVDLGGGYRLESRGTLGWDDYFALLAESDVVLSLQASPHPSHPPLEAALSGAVAITNEVEGTRAQLHPRLRAVDVDPAALGSTIVNAIRAARGDTAERGPDGTLTALGRAMASSLDALADVLRSR